MPLQSDVDKKRARTSSGPGFFMRRRRIVFPAESVQGFMRFVLRPFLVFPQAARSESDPMEGARDPCRSIRRLDFTWFPGNRS